MTQIELDEFIESISGGSNGYFHLNADELIYVFRKPNENTVYYCRYSETKGNRNLYSEFISNSNEFLDKLTIWKLSN